MVAKFTSRAKLGEEALSLSNSRSLQERLMSHPAPDNRQPGDARMRRSKLHMLISTANQLQELPGYYLGISIALNAALTGFFWWQYAAPSLALLVVIGYLVITGADWLMLWELPQRGRSYGPDKPSAFALAAVNLL